MAGRGGTWSPGKGGEHMKRRMTLDDAPTTLTLDEVREVTRIGRNTLYEWVRTGKLRSLKVGRRVLVPKSAVEELVEGGADA
jgi:excisionase family DNA binding protein